MVIISERPGPHASLEGHAKDEGGRGGEEVPFHARAYSNLSGNPRAGAPAASSKGHVPINATVRHSANSNARRSGAESIAHTHKELDSDIINLQSLQGVSFAAQKGRDAAVMTGPKKRTSNLQAPSAQSPA